MPSDNLPAPILPEFPPKSEFRKWLRSLPPDEVVARHWNCFRCPMAEWMTRTGLVADKVFIRPGGPVSPGIWRPDDADAQLLPEWAEAFGNGIDRLGRAGRLEGEGFGPVTASDCLAVLSRTPRG